MVPGKTSDTDTHLSSEELRQLLGEVRRENDTLRLRVGWLERLLLRAGVAYTGARSGVYGLSGVPSGVTPPASQETPPPPSTPKARSTTLRGVAPPSRSSAEMPALLPGSPEATPQAPPSAHESATTKMAGWILLDSRGRIQSLNQRAGALLSLTPAARGGLLFDEVLPEHLGRQLREDFHRFMLGFFSGERVNVSGTLRPGDPGGAVEFSFGKVKNTDDQFVLILRETEPHEARLASQQWVG
jgi:PAS domain-containing protein